MKRILTSRPTTPLQVALRKESLRQRQSAQAWFTVVKFGWGHMLMPRKWTWRDDQ